MGRCDLYRPLARRVQGGRAQARGDRDPQPARDRHLDPHAVEGLPPGPDPRRHLAAGRRPGDREGRRGPLAPRLRSARRQRQRRADRGRPQARGCRLTLASKNDFTIGISASIVWPSTEIGAPITTWTGWPVRIDFPPGGKIALVPVIATGTIGAPVPIARWKPPFLSAPIVP